ncbi:glycosyltransferase family 2 protein [Algicella marina]|uniref:Glycosyltransferase n=1 Tax=Algicella marina TaxID=2683284 RepID=A0A6P1T3Y2_9RHOB|nr:glycosyltransferase family 2 protein [Algicella marina]QHQ36420.1 glycosyltransferase [Algicella marina]
MADLSGVLIAIPALNEASHIRGCITSLAGAARDGARLVVADGGSTDGTLAELARLAEEVPGLEVLHNPARLQSAGINAVVAQKAGPEHHTLVRCDAHAVYPPGFAARVAAALAARDSAALAVPMDARDTSGNGFAAAAAWIVDTPLGSGGAAHRGGRRSGYVEHGHHAGIGLAWFRRIGGYDPAFSHNEDAEFDVRLAQAGGRIWLDAAIRLDYAMRPTAAALARQYWQYGRGRAATLMKHRLRPRLRQLLPVANLLACGAALAAAPIWRWALLWPGAYGLALTGASLLCAVRLRRPAGLWAGVALAVMHVCWAAGFLAHLGKRTRA